MLTLQNIAHNFRSTQTLLSPTVDFQNEIKQIKMPKDMKSLTLSRKLLENYLLVNYYIFIVWFVP